MLRSLFLLLLSALALAFSSTAFANPPGTDDRWLELDLYWFSAEQPERSAATFWDRYRLLFADVRGYRGVVLNVGFSPNYIMEFSGNLDQQIALPKGAGQEIGARLTGPLLGDTAQRQQAWRDRFRAHDNAAARVGYGPWTYGGLKRLAAALRSEGARRGVSDFRVATLTVGQDGAYGEKASFAIAHPEAWTQWSELAPGALASSSHFDPNARLRADATRRAGFPSGWPADTPLSRAFALQWGALSRSVGLDGIMLRDSFSFPRAYTRYGPWGPSVPDAATAERTTAGLARLIRESKQANPRALIMMYSTAATATSDWRANGIDLESIAAEGFLDIFVDQTWAGAWNEVGVRQQTFWNAPILGWTYQLAYLMQHAAVLAKSKVRHYYLTEAFDAWESWDTLHTAPERVRWGIWAFSHVAVKTPRGLKMPAGSYVSWGNHGQELLSEQDVAFLARELREAARDAAETREVFGPTVVYSRAAMAGQLAALSPKFDARDRIDEQVGSLIKWPLPIMSITRMEWLDEVQSDLFVFGASTGGGRDQEAALARLTARGQPMAFFGGFNNGIDPAALKLAGASAAPHRHPQQDPLLRATADLSGLPVANVAAGFDAKPTAMRNTASGAKVIYSFGESAALIRRKDARGDVVLWDPAPLSDYWFRPLRDNMNGSPAPYVLAAATLTAQLADAGKVRARTIDERQTGAFGAWRGADGRIRLLFGNLEEGLRDDGDLTRRLSIALPDAWRPGRWTDAWSGRDARTADQTLTVELAPYASRLLIGPSRTSEAGSDERSAAVTAKHAGG
jgi:hypothetical protein